MARVKAMTTVRIIHTSFDFVARVAIVLQCPL